MTTEIFCPSEICSKFINNDSLINVAYTRADGEHDCLHYIYSTFGAPTVLVAKTSSYSHLNVNWKLFLSQNVTDIARSLTFTNDTPETVLALVFTKVNILKVFCSDYIWKLEKLLTGHCGLLSLGQ